MSKKSPLTLSQRKKNWRERCRSKGLCMDCGKSNTRLGKTRCEPCTDKRRKYYKQNRTEIIRKVSEHQKKNIISRREYMREYSRSARIDAIKKMGGKCIRCRFKDFRALQIDHVNGDGYLDNIDVSLGKSHGRQTSGIAFLKKVLADKKGSYQLLCANCNWIK